MDKVEQTYWDQSYTSYHYGIADDAVTRWLVPFINGKSGSAFEPGCYPGRYLAHLGRCGWTVSGMDLTPRVETDFVGWLRDQRIATGMIRRGDVLQYMASSPDRYDLVCSFGFIEHFENFLDVLALHGQVLRSGGTLIITTPNFAGIVQKTLHRWLDAENLSRHHLPSMKPRKWKEKLEAMGYQVAWSGYFGHFDFWADRQSRSGLKNFCLKLISRLGPFLRWLPNARAWSPYCGLVASKPLH